MESKNQKTTPLSVIQRMLEKKAQIIAERQQRRMAVQSTKHTGSNGMRASVLT